MYVSGMLKQKVKAVGIKIERNDERRSVVKAEPPVQNQLEAVLVYETLDGKKPGETVLPDPQNFSIWSKIWSEDVGHNERVSWLEDVEVYFSTTRGARRQQHHSGGY